MLGERHADIAATVTLKSRVLSRSPVVALWELIQGTWLDVNDGWGVVDVGASSGGDVTRVAELSVKGF
jgi:hypothetical protein